MGGLLEDAETKNVALEKVEELEEHVSHVGGWPSPAARTTVEGGEGRGTSEFQESRVDPLASTLSLGKPQAPLGSLEHTLAEALDHSEI